MHVAQFVMQAAAEGQFAMPPQDVLQELTHMWLAEQPYAAPVQATQSGTHVCVDGQAKVVPVQVAQFGMHAPIAEQK